MKNRLCSGCGQYNQVLSHYIGYKKAEVVEFQLFKGHFGKLTIKVLKKVI